MLINILLALVSLIASDSKEKNYVARYDSQFEDVYDFEYQGLYYEFAGNEEVNLVRKSSVLLPDWETSTMDNLELAYDLEINRCYTGDIVVPDSVEFQGKKYRVTSVNQHAFSFSKGLKSVTLTSSVELPITGNIIYCRGHFCMSKDLERVMYHDSISSLQFNLEWCNSVKEIHFPRHLTSIKYSLFGTEMPEIDLGNKGKYRPPHFYAEECFHSSPKLQRLKFPECDTLHLKVFYLMGSPNVEHIVIRPCKVIIQESYDIPYWPIKYGTKPLKIVCEELTPPEVLLINQRDELMYRDKAILYVPDEAMEAYEEAYYWRDFGDIRPMSEYIREEDAAIDSPIVSEAAEPMVSLSSDREELHITVSAPAEVTVWSLQGQALWQGTVMDEVVVTLPKGVYIVTTPTTSRKYRH